jgi:hypothetical protein
LKWTEEVSVPVCMYIEHVHIHHFSAYKNIKIEIATALNVWRNIDKINHKQHIFEKYEKDDGCCYYCNLENKFLISCVFVDLLHTNRDHAVHTTNVCNEEHTDFRFAKRLQKGR